MNNYNQLQAKLNACRHGPTMHGILSTRLVSVGERSDSIGHLREYLHRLAHSAALDCERRRKMNSLKLPELVVHWPIEFSNKRIAATRTPQHRPQFNAF